jgi:transglutaminase-like putative cysteine protease
MPSAEPRREADSRPSARPQALNWSISLVLVFTLAAALGGIMPLLRDSSWWAVAITVAAVVTVAISVARALTRWWFWGPLAGVLALLIVLTFFYAPESALAAFLPTPDVFVAFNRLVLDGFDSIATQGVPAKLTEGITFLLAAGTGVTAIVLDGFAFVVRRPALVGIPLLALLSIGSIVDPGSFNPFFAVTTALGYLLVLYLAIGERRLSGAAAVGAAGIVAALVLPLALPPIVTPENTRDGSGFVVGVNTFVSLGQDLRRPNVTRVLTYNTDSGFGQYLTMSVIDDFTGTEWTPSEPAFRPTNLLDDIDRAPGLGAGIDVLSTTTAVSIVNMGGKWLPAPYSPRSIDGLAGEWSWDPQNRTVSSPTASARGAEYTVVSDIANPTVQDLRASGTSVTATGLDADLALPPDLDPLVTQTAIDAIGGATTHYDMAVALQDYFLSGEFTYSTQAPVAGNYDGTGAAVVAEFLQKKSGYCVHFASAMAVMARTLGIPARIAVGFTPGEYQGEGQDNYFAVTTANLHAWPELYFDGVGWVRFEPTVSVGEQPVFADTTAGPTPAPGTTVAPTAVPTRSAVPTAAATPTPTAGAIAQTGNSAANRVVQWVVVGLLIAVLVGVIAVPLVPIARRFARRLRRYWQIARRRSAVAAWLELRDTAIDLGFDAASTTPRELAELLWPGLPERPWLALERLREAIESDAYSRDAGRATVADVQRVRRGMWWNSTREQRLRAAFSPASVVSAARSFSRSNQRTRSGAHL